MGTVRYTIMLLTIDGENPGDVTRGALETVFYRRFRPLREW